MRSVGLSPATDIVLCDSRLRDTITSTLNRKKINHIIYIFLFNIEVIVIIVIVISYHIFI